MTKHSTDLRTLLRDPSLLETRAFVAGEWVEADDGATFDVTNPARGDVIAKVTDLGRAEAARAIDAAEAAMKGWAARTAKERAQIMRKWFDLMMENQDDLARILTAEMGKPFPEAKGEIAYGASFIEWFGEEAKRIYGETIPGHMADKRITVIRQPIGVVGSITPWNFPNAMIARKVAPALAVGCGFVARPAAETPLSALAMAVLARARGPAQGHPVGHHVLALVRHRQGVLREPEGPQADLHRLDRGGAHPAAAGRRPGDEMLDGTGRQRALHRLRRRRS